jgi:sugar-specific transcriptional regulator TrmB
MSKEEKLIEKLRQWVEEHPEAADAPTVNVTTQKTFTMREMLNEFTRAKEEEIAIVDKETLEIKSQIEKWLKMDDG